MPKGEPGGRFQALHLPKRATERAAGILSAPKTLIYAEEKRDRFLDFAELIEKKGENMFG